MKSFLKVENGTTNWKLSSKDHVSHLGVQLQFLT